MFLICKLDIIPRSDYLNQENVQTSHALDWWLDCNKYIEGETY